MIILMFCRHHGLDKLQKETDDFLYFVFLSSHSNITLLIKKINKMRVDFTKMKTGLFLLLLTLFCQSIFAQTQTPLDLALRHLEQTKDNSKLVDSDIADMVLTSQTQSAQSGATFVYLMQRHQGIEIYNAIYNVTISKEGEAVFAGNNLAENIAQSVNTTQPSISASEALKFALNHLGSTTTEALVEKERSSDKKFVFEKGTFSHNDIPVQLKYQRVEGGLLRLAWDLSIDYKGGNDYWSLRVDAVTGEVINKNSWTVHCSIGHGTHAHHEHDASCRDYSKVKVTSKKSMEVKEALAAENAGTNLFGIYNVYAEKDANGNLHPHESPIHGERNLITGATNPDASPFGWHDVDGVMGPEYSITRGNNVHAYLDVNDAGVSQGDEPDGGGTLTFDFPLDLTLEPADYQEASVTNAFFMTNFMHEFAYAYGFDEASGNFQQNNYGNGGDGNDYVLAEIQDGSGTNNANFATPEDGGNGRMQMFLWTNGASGLMVVEEPSQVAGDYETSGQTDGWGGTITTTPVTGEVSFVDDGTNNPGHGCEPLVNDLTGKVALVERGFCQFGTKALNAQNAGAIAVLICNFEDQIIGMAAGDDGAMVTIPVLFMSSPDCDQLRPFVGNGLSVSFVSPTITGPAQLDAGIDNGVIAHEFGHGISNRLTGGPLAAGCLGQGEQMGEGWSDFFSLVTTVKPGDTGEMKRGIGTYVNAESDPDGRGIRRYPYSTDMNINPLTYSDILGQGVHATGEVWVLACWEMYWAMVDKHGFDPDHYNGTGGNNMAVQLVMEGMKMQPCDPGFVTGRDAILAADELLYNGDNQCLIWEAFAKRGIGVDADQVSPLSNTDGIEGFESLPTCIRELKIKKSVTPLVTAGDEITVFLTVTNHKETTVPNVVVTDAIPTGTSIVAGSATNGGTVTGDMIVFELGDMETLAEVEISYKLSTDGNIFSVQQWFDDMESGDANWDLDVGAGTNIWEINDLFAYSGTNAWFVEDPETESEMFLYNIDPITIQGNQPVLRFFHRYDSEAGADGGLVEISTDGGSIYTLLNTEFFRNAYPRDLQYGTFAIPFLQAFSGDSEGFIDSYADLTPYIGEDVHIRFRFGSDDNTGGLGWSVDDIEIMDMINHDTEACVTSDDGDNACARGEERGTIIDSEVVTSLDNPFDTNMEVLVFPNPTEDFINLRILNDEVADATVRVLTIDGKEVMNRSLTLSSNVETLSLDVADLAAGMYLVKVSTDESIVIEKVTIK